MKPFLLNIVVVVVALHCAVCSAAEQTPGSVLVGQPEAIPSPLQAPQPSLWGAPPPPPWTAPLPYGDLWNDYCPEKTTRHFKGSYGHVHIRQAKPVKNLVVVLCGWIETLLCGKNCQDCSPAPANCAIEHAQPTFEPSQLPHPAPQPLTEVGPVPALPQPDEQMTLPKIAPPPAAAIVESQPPKPLEISEEPKSIRGPVVELAPDFVLPPDQRPAPPRNVIPTPGVATPRNSVPAQ